jgi:8-oxo-dGTP diphosphatase
VDETSVQTQAVSQKVYPYVQVAAAILRRGNAVVLVREKRGDATFWSLPGGGVETGELITEALVREIKEETGVTLRSPGRLAYLVNSSNSRFPSSVAFFFESEDWDGDIAPIDPDQDVMSAALFSFEEALEMLADSQATRPEIEPLMAYLRDSNASFSVWSYRDDVPAMPTVPPPD